MAVELTKWTQKVKQSQLTVVRSLHIVICSGITDIISKAIWTYMLLYMLNA